MDLPKGWRRFATDKFDWLLNNLDDSTDEYEAVNYELALREISDERVQQAAGVWAGCDES